MTGLSEIEGLGSLRDQGPGHFQIAIGHHHACPGGLGLGEAGLGQAQFGFRRVIGRVTSSARRRGTAF